MATPTKIVGGTELDQQAPITTNHFPGIYRGKSCSHLGVGGPERASPGTERTKLDTVPDLQRNLRHHPCGCQAQSADKNRSIMLEKQHDTMNDRRTAYAAERAGKGTASAVPPKSAKIPGFSP